MQTGLGGVNQTDEMGKCQKNWAFKRADRKSSESVWSPKEITWPQKSSSIRVFFHLNRGGRSHIMIFSSYACRLLVSFSSLFFHLLTPFFSLLKTVTFYTEKVLSISSHTILSQTVSTPLSEAEVSKWSTTCPLNFIRCHQ